MVAPCMMMADHPFAQRFPNLHETPLKDILGDSELMKLSQTKVADVRNGNDECRKCPHVEKCSGGCRQSALSATGNYYGPEKSVCTFFNNGWDKLIYEASLCVSILSLVVSAVSLGIALESRKK